MAAKPITLNVRDVALAAKKAYDEKRLSAQGDCPRCRYRDPVGRPCAIGAALPDAAARRFDELAVSYVGELAARGLIVTDDLPALSRLQAAHDDWVTAHRTSRAFRDMLSRILAKPVARKVGV